VLSLASTPSHARERRWVMGYFSKVAVHFVFHDANY